MKSLWFARYFHKAFFRANVPSPWMIRTCSNLEMRAEFRKETAFLLASSTCLPMMLHSRPCPETMAVIWEGMSSFFFSLTAFAAFFSPAIFRVIFSPSLSRITSFFLTEITVARRQSSSLTSSPGFRSRIGREFFLIGSS